jgi:hypothetical protein
MESSSSSEFNGVGDLVETGLLIMEFPKSESTSVEGVDGGAVEETGEEALLFWA